MSLKIMVVDGEPKSVQLMMSVATPLGHTVLPLGDYRAAAKKGDAQPFDAVFVGMRPPERNGIDLAHRIRNSEPNHDTAIVMVTATEDISLLRQAFGEGADLIVTEPVQAGRMHRMLSAMNAPGWKLKKPAARLLLNTRVVCNWNARPYSLPSLNISESGMLLHSSVMDLPLGEELSLEFKIAEVHASLNLRARIVRKDQGAKLIGVRFIDLAREDQNAIRVYVMGREH